MTTATLTSKGRITLPAEIRRVLNVRTGDRLDFVQVEPGRFEIVAATRSVREIRSMFGKPGRRASIDDMTRAIAERGVAASTPADARAPARRGLAK